MLEALPGLLIGIVIMLWLWQDSRDAERRRTQPERIRKSMRDWEIDYLAAIEAEDHLRRILIGDLKAIVAKEKAKAYLREHYG